MYQPTAGTCNPTLKEILKKRKITEPITTIRISVIANSGHRFDERQQQAVKIGWLISSILCLSSLRMEE